MKKLLFSAALLVGASTAASAQTSALKVNIFSPIFKTGSFFFEHQVSEHRSLQLGGLFTAWGSGSTSITGFALTPEYRFYLSDNKPALEGFYFAPFLRYQSLTLKTKYEYVSIDGGGTLESKASLNTYGGGVLAGYQCLFKKRFTLDAFMGPAYNGGEVKLTSGDASQTFNPGPFAGFGLRSGVTFGVAF
jgi:hypothetical protein